VWAPLLDVSRPATAIATPAQVDVLAEPDCKFSELAVPAVAEVADAFGHEPLMLQPLLARQLAFLSTLPLPPQRAAAADATNGHDQTACVPAAAIAASRRPC